MSVFSALFGFFLLISFVPSIFVLERLNEEKKTWKEYVKDCQDSIAGQIIMTLFYWPAAIVSWRR